MALTTACTSGNANQPPLKETKAVAALEQQIAAYAQGHTVGTVASGGLGTGGTPTRCETRILGRKRSVEGPSRAYLEILCAQWSAGRRCLPAQASSGLMAAEALLTPAGAVARMNVDDNDDQAYTRWVIRHYPAAFRHLEVGGPRYGRLLFRRLTRSYECHPTS